MSKLPLSLRRASSKFSSKRENFYEYLADALDDNADIDTEIDIQRKRYLSAKDSLATLFAHWHSRMSQGKFNVAIKDTVPQSDLMIISAAEMSSTLPEGLRFLAKSIRQMKAMASAIKSACFFPLFMVLVLFGMMYLFATLLAPILVQIYPVENFPTGGKIFYYLAMGFKENWPWIAAVVLAVPTLFAISLPRLTGPFRNFLDQHAPYSIYRDYQASLFLVSFSSLITSGVSFDEALKLMLAQSNKYMTWQISSMLRRYPLNPTKPAKALEVGLFPKELRFLIEDYGRRNSFGDALKKIGLVAIEKTAQRVIATSKFMNQVLIAIVGGYLVFSILSVFSVAYQAQAEIKAQVRQTF